jgi:hypothetical protein
MIYTVISLFESTSGFIRLDYQRNFDIRERWKVTQIVQEIEGCQNLKTY